MTARRDWPARERRRKLHAALENFLDSQRAARREADAAKYRAQRAARAAKEAKRRARQSGGGSRP